jgi:hypothetical protein
VRGRQRAVALLLVAGALALSAAPLAPAEVSQSGTLRVSVNGTLSPRALPRKGAAPIAVAVDSRISTTDQTQPPKLRSLQIEINRHGRLDTAGLKTCPYQRIETASSAQALRACRSALVGEGSFEASVSVGSQEPYPAKARLLIFNGTSKGRSVLLGQIFSARPFASSFVIVFRLARRQHGTYGTILTAALPSSLGGWGVVTGVKMRLSRRYRAGGTRHSFLSAGCPAPRGFSRVSFPLARVSFRFSDHVKLTSTLTRSCRARQAP